MKWRIASGIAFFVLLGISIGWINRRDVWHGSYNSPAHIGQVCVDALNRADTEALHRLRVNREEYLAWIWTEFPAGRPPRNFPGDFAWSNLNKQSVLAMGKWLQTYSGKNLTFVDIRFEAPTEKYNGFTLQRGTVLTVSNADGETLELRILGSVVEKAGRCKLLSFKE